LPASTILELAEDGKFDLIVMGAKGHGLVDNIFLGSTVEKVMPFSTCSLLIVR
jgi:nucleotide-binding universal stress UspA family protein